MKFEQSRRQTEFCKELLLPLDDSHVLMKTVMILTMTDSEYRFIMNTISL